MLLIFISEFVCEINFGFQLFSYFSLLSRAISDSFFFICINAREFPVLSLHCSDSDLQMLLLAVIVVLCSFVSRFSALSSPPSPSERLTSPKRLNCAAGWSCTASVVCVPALYVAGPCCCG